MGTGAGRDLKADVDNKLLAYVQNLRNPKYSSFFKPIRAIIRP